MPSFLLVVCPFVKCLTIRRVFRCSGEVVCPGALPHHKVVWVNKQQQELVVWVCKQQEVVCSKQQEPMA